MLQNKTPFDCNKCTDRDKDIRNCANYKEIPEEFLAIEKYTDESTEYFKKHNLKKVAPLDNGKQCIRLYECPASYITHDTSDIIRLLYTIENTNYLLFDGGLAKQPYWLVQAMELFNIEIHMNRKAKAE
jgi:hypothetical protein